MKIIHKFNLIRSQQEFNQLVCSQNQASRDELNTAKILIKMKHELRKKEKEIYVPKTNPELIRLPEYQFVTISGEGNPNGEFFTECIVAL